MIKIVPLGFNSETSESARELARVQAPYRSYVQYYSDFRDFYMNNSHVPRGGASTVCNVLYNGTDRFSRLFALRSKAYGLLGYEEVTAALADPASSGTTASLLADLSSVTPAYAATSPDTSVTVRFDFAPPLPQLSPDSEVLILGRRYVVSRLEYELSPGQPPILRGYFHPFQ